MIQQNTDIDCFNWLDRSVFWENETKLTSFVNNINRLNAITGCACLQDLWERTELSMASEQRIEILN